MSESIKLPLGHKIMRQIRYMVFKFRKLLTLRRGRSWLESCFIQVPQVTDASQGPVLCRPTNNVLTSFKNMSNIVCGPAQDEAAEKLPIFHVSAYIFACL